MRYLTKKDIKLPKRKPESHKGDNGRLLIIGGSVDYIGAVMLAGMAAFRCGIDIVTIAAPEKVSWAINTFSPDFITKKFKGEFFRVEQANKIIELSNDFDSVLIGNGMGIRKQTLRFSQKIIKNIKKPKVIDADAIKALGFEVNNSIITPHENELKIFLENNLKNKKKVLKEIFNKKINPEKRAKNIQSALKDFLEKNNVILLKGKIDIIISKDKIKFNKTGNAGMSVAGTGDVLAGLTAGFLAQTKNLFDSACSAAFINGIIGDYLLKKKGYGFIASDFIDYIPLFIKN
ncbi:MAG: NAD(P)H-hydrate dehydratase [Nanoarchaeota archaeon]|nr:NAD(P)H-hydrate dehydratase [Nanoarchaeota archaeon]